MKVLVGYMVASVVGAIILVHLFDYLVAGASGKVVSVARASIFVTTWTAINTSSLMHGLSERVRSFRGWLNTRR